jgi:hypothetical protein
MIDLTLLTTNLSSPALLFFGLGLLAAVLKSDLEFPQPLPKLFSIYLLVSLGYRGGYHLQQTGLSLHLVEELLVCVALSFGIPWYCFALLRRRLDVPNSAGIAATYGSISAVTFITAGVFLQNLGLQHSGWMVAAMALMESPSIVAGLMLVRRHSPQAALCWSALLHEAFCNSSVLLLLGSLGVGFVSGAKGMRLLEPCLEHGFYGVLCLFLLDMGLVAGKRVHLLKAQGFFLIGFALGIPLVNAVLGTAAAWVLGLNLADAFMLVVLCASASYIAVPAALRLAIPQANPSYYLPMALGLTFPLNITLGLPLYLGALRGLGCFEG